MTAICELLLETTPQYLLQWYLAEFLYESVRCTTPMQMWSMEKSFFVLIFHLSKLILPHLSNQDKTLSKKVKKVVWVVFLNSSIGLSVLVNFIIFRKFYNLWNPVNFYTLLVLIVCVGITLSVILVSKIVKKSRKAKLVYLIITLLYSILTGCLIHLSIVISYVVPIFIGGICLQSLLIVVFTKALFLSTSTMFDIWNLDRLIESSIISNLFLCLYVFFNGIFCLFWFITYFIMSSGDT